MKSVLLMISIVPEHRPNMKRLQVSSVFNDNIFPLKTMISNLIVPVKFMCVSNITETECNTTNTPGRKKRAVL